MNWLNRIRGEWMVQPRRFLAVLWVILLAVGWSGVAEAAAPVAGIITVEREGKATEGPDLLSGRHPEVVQPFKATLRLTDPNNLCAMPNPNATWTWSVKSVNFSPAAGLDYDPMPTQNGSLAQKVKALADAKAAGITFEVVATEPFLSRCKAKIPAELLDVPGEWTITVQSIWSCPLSGGGQPVSFSGSEDFSYVFHVWTVQLQVDDGAGRHVHAPVNDYAMFKDEVGEIRKHGGEGRKTDKQGNLLHLDKHEKIFPFQVKLHARVLGAPTQEKDPVVVTLANPDGRLGFPTVDKGDPTVKLPIKGTVWHKAHAVNGQVKSAGVGDAVIEVHKGEVLITKRPMTVFWFEGTVAGEAKGEYKVRGEDPRLPKYRWNQRGDINQDFFVSNFGTGTQVNNPPAIEVKSTVKLLPQGCDVKAAQIRRWRVGHVQNITALTHKRQAEFGENWFKWGGAARQDTSYTSKQRDSWEVAFKAAQLPVLDNAPRAGTPLWADRATPPLSVDRAVIVCATHDTPNFNMPVQYNPADGKNWGGSLYRWAYPLQTASMADAFTVWSAVNDGASTVPLAAFDWSLAVDEKSAGAAANAQIGAVPNPVPPLSPPVTDTGKVGLDYFAQIRAKLDGNEIKKKFGK